MSRRFFQIRLGQLLLLIVLLSVLLGLCTSYLHRTYQAFELDRTYRRHMQAQKELGQAIRDNDVNSAKRALASGYTVQQFLDSSPHDPLLHICIANGQIGIVEVLLESGADVEKFGQGSLPRSTPSRRPPFFHFRGPPLFAAIGSPQPAEIRKEMIRLLVQYGADPLKKSERDNAMDVAVRAGDAEVADLLREYGLPYGLREMATFNRLDELKRAVTGNPDAVKQRYDPVYAALPGQGPTLLGIALSHGYREMAMYLIDAGAPLDSLEYLSETLLHRAARGGDPELIRLLVSRGLEVNVRSEEGDIPLCIASALGHTAAVEALLESGADVHAREGGNGRTALSLAAWCNHLETLKPLLAAGADATETIRELRAEAGRPNLAVWQKSIDLDMARRLEELASDPLQ